jgi:hypothetical protein
MGMSITKGFVFAMEHSALLEIETELANNSMTFILQRLTRAKSVVSPKFEVILLKVFFCMGRSINYFTPSLS